MEYHINIKRFNPEQDPKPHWEEYTVQADPNNLLLDALINIKGHHDGTLTLRYSCGHGICGSDAMVINRQTRLACKTVLKHVAARPEVPIFVEPMRSFPVIKDLVVDMRLFYEKYYSIQPFLINDSPPPSTERLQSPKERERFDETTRCILCGACTGSCPTFWANKEYVAPAAIVQAHRFIFDSRDEATQERLTLLGQEGGVFTCRSIYNCSEACPRDIDVVKAINEVRQAILLGRR
jgi:succinate dehydrogenase / fumarate reductase, iron-sulfur subunit